MQQPMVTPCCCLSFLCRLWLKSCWLLMISSLRLSWLGMKWARRHRVSSSPQSAMCSIVVCWLALPAGKRLPDAGPTLAPLAGLNGAPYILQGGPLRTSMAALALCKGSPQGFQQTSLHFPGEHFAWGAQGFQRTPLHFARGACQDFNKIPGILPGWPVRFPIRGLACGRGDLTEEFNCFVCMLLAPYFFVKSSKCCRQALRISTKFIERSNGGP